MMGYYTVPEAAEVSGMKLDKMWERIARGYITTVLFDDVVMVPASAIAPYVQREDEHELRDH